MARADIHRLIEGYFNATLSEQQESELRQMLTDTAEDSDDIREAKATMGLLAMGRKLNNRHLHTQKPKTVWGKVKYAAVFFLGALLDIAFDDDLTIKSE